MNDLVCTVCGTTGSFAEAATIPDHEGKRVSVRCCTVCLALVPDYFAEWAGRENLERQITFHEDVLWNETTADEMVTAAADLVQTITNLEQHFGPPTGAHLVCDIGAGRGSLAQALLQRGYRVLACEPAPGLVRLAREHYELGEDVLLEMTWQAFLDELDERRVRPDVFVLWHVLEHVDDPIELLRALRARSAADGRIVMQLPLLYGPYLYPEHNFFVTHGGLVRLASAAGFDVAFTEIDLDCMYFTVVLAPGDVLPFGPTPDGVSQCLAETIEILERALLSRSEACEAQAALLEERYHGLIEMKAAAAAMTEERDATIATQAKVLQQRWQAMSDMEHMIQERDATIAAQAKMLDERWEAMTGMDRMIEEREQVHRRTREALERTAAPIAMSKRLAWLVPYPIKGSGGHRTFFAHIQYLCEQGYECDVYVHPEGDCEVTSVAALARDYFRVTGANIKLGFDVHGHYDMIVATVWWSANRAARLQHEAPKAYFIQDYEAWFDAMGDGYILAEDTYRLGLIPITIGRWLSSRMAKEFGTPSNFFPFTADQNIYRPLTGIQREKAVCFLYQPEKPRRCPVIGREALGLLKHQRPDVAIYTYGTDEAPDFWFEHKHLGLLSWEDCNRLYNSCAVGLSLSASNPSRVPFEMMAAGLPVVDFHGDNTIYDMPNDAVLLAEKNPEALANTLIQVLDREDQQESMRAAALQHMRGLPAEREFEACRDVIDDVIEGRTVGSMNWRPTYTREPVRAVRPEVTPRRSTGSARTLHEGLASYRRAVRRMTRAARLGDWSGFARRPQGASTQQAAQELRTLGQSCAPIFAGFAAFIHAEAERCGHSEIFFFTREGKFFRDCYRLLQQAEQYADDRRALHLLPVSRVATFMPSIREMSTDEMMRLWTLYSIQSMEAMLNTLGVDVQEFVPVLRRHGIDPREVITYPWQVERVQELFADPAFIEPIHRERDRRRSLLDEFLRNRQFVGRGDRLIVDIGWRGSIQDNLAHLYPDMRIDGLYLGLQRYLNDQPGNTTKKAFLVDANQDDDPFAYLIRYVKPMEMMCNSTGGSVTGYAQGAGTVEATVALDPEEDLVHTRFVAHFQAGVLEGIPTVFDWARRESVSLGDLTRVAREDMRDLIWSGEPTLARAFFSLRHNETFGVGGSVQHMPSLSLADCLVALAVRDHRERALAPLRGSGWPHAVLRSRYLGLGYRMANQKRLLHRL